MSEWQLIETAPKDGTKVFLYKHGWECAPIAWWDQIEYDENGVMISLWLFESDTIDVGGVQEGQVGWNEDVESGIMPTHWMRLPEAPK